MGLLNILSRSARLHCPDSSECPYKVSACKVYDNFSTCSPQISHLLLAKELVPFTSIHCSFLSGIQLIRAFLHLLLFASPTDKCNLKNFQILLLLQWKTKSFLFILTILNNYKTSKYFPHFLFEIGKCRAHLIVKEIILTSKLLNKL